jgi:hypothetical protein
MDVLPRITRQLFELFRAMSPVQRATFVMVPVLMVGGFIWLLAANRPSDLQPVSFGKAFATDELTAVEKALNQAGLTEYRRGQAGSVQRGARRVRCGAVGSGFADSQAV